MFTTTVDSILKDFTVKIDKLRSISVAQNAVADTHLETSARAITAANVAPAEATRADNVAKKIEALIG